MKAKITLVNSTLSDSSTGDSAQVPDSCRNAAFILTGTKNGGTATVTVTVEGSWDKITWFTLVTLGTSLSSTTSVVGHVMSETQVLPRFIRGKTTFSAASASWSIRLMAELTN